MQIGVMGARGSFSEKAGKTFVAQQNGKYADATFKYLVSAESVLSQLEAGDIDIGVVAFENSNGGFVMETLDALCAHNCRRLDIVEVNVHHQLLVRPGVTREDVKIITSHPQALIQCDQYIRRNWKGVVIQDYADTAKAAEDLSRGNLPEGMDPMTTAAIASLEAGNMFSLEILERNIEDRKFNVTNFLVAERR